MRRSPSRLFMSSSSSENQVKHVVIAGAGVMGTTTAYYLAKEFGISSTLIDPTGKIAPAASGKAGGFLALDWNDSSPVGTLARRSFDLHQELADALGADKIQYRRLTCAAVSVDGSSASQRPKGKKLEGIEWAEGAAVMGVRSLGDEETIAQVHPKLLCDALFAETQRLTPDSKLVAGTVVTAEHADDSSSLQGAKLQDGSIVPGDALLYACGPWTSNVMTGIKYHSVVVPTDDVLSQCVFFSGFGDPEVYVRPDQTAYCTGFPDREVRVTERPGEEEVRPEAIERIQQAVQQASNLVASDRGEPLNQSCYLPSTPDGLPLMGALPDQPHCYVAAGHSCWGILMGPATGEAMAHLVATGKSPHVNLQKFDPARMGTMDMVP
jgi:glycine/D-amino acid oxidase-like deaminating enzyme